MTPEQKAFFEYGGAWEQVVLTHKGIRSTVKALPGKTHLCLWDEDLPESSVILPKSGTARVDRLKAIGNGQVPAVAATAFRVFLGRFQEGKEGE